MNTRILAFSGKMGSGKSTAIQALRAQVDQEVVLLKFADPMYAIQAFAYGQVKLPVPQPKDRKLLQWLGTEWGRSIDPNLWVNAWVERVKWELEQSPTSIIVCDDCRFDNEAEAVHALGGKIVRVEADDSLRRERIELINTGHASEAGIDSKHVDFNLVNNGSKTDLAYQVDVMRGYL